MAKQGAEFTGLTLSALLPDPHNRRKHTPRNVDMIAAALRSVGAARSIVIDEINEVLAGNGVVEAAAQAGISKLQIVDADGDTIVAVRRRGLTDEQKRALAIFDNRTAELAEWDVAQLRADNDAGLDLTPFFFDEEIGDLLALGDGIAHASLIERFGVPPFSVLDARQGYWQERKRAWLALGIESELGRGPGTWSTRPDAVQAEYKRRARAVAPGGAPRPAMKIGKGGRIKRGDGKGRAID